MTRLAGMLCLALAAGACQRAPEQGPEPENAAEARTLDEFQERVEAYAAIHKRIEASLPALPAEATPTQIDEHQREFGKRLALARPTAKQGDLFTPDMETLVRRHLTRIFSAPDGPALKSSVNDENPVGIKFNINARYPDAVPMSTMPPDVLQILPKMPRELMYRFVGRALVIIDEQAHLIADYVPGVVPE